MSTTSSPRPPKQSPPSERDLKIFRLAEIHGLSHDGIVVELGGEITRRRVSQIVQEVRRWLATHPCPDDSLATDIEHKRYARQLERLYLQNVIDRAIDGLNHAPKTLATNRLVEGINVGRTEREQPPVDVRLLRTYLRAVVALGKLNERPELPLPPPPPKEQEPWMHATIQEVVKRWQLEKHNYLLSDQCLEKFAQDLSVAFLDYLEEHPPAPSTDDQKAETELDDPQARDEPAVRRGSPDPAVLQPPADATSDASDVSQDCRVGSAHHSPGIADAASSASDVSQGEALEPAATSSSALDASDDSTATSGEATTHSFATNEPESSREKIEKGSVPAPIEEKEEYVKRLWHGPLPPDHPALREGPPIRRRSATPQPVIELQIKPSEPGAAIQTAANITTRNAPTQSAAPS